MGPTRYKNQNLPSLVKGQRERFGLSHLVCTKRLVTHTEEIGQTS